MLWVCSLGLVSESVWHWLEAPWQRTTAAEAPPAEAIVLLSGGRHPAPGAARVSEWHYPDRFLAGLDLYRAGKAPRLLFTGGASPFRPGQPPEGQRYLREAQQLGIPDGVMANTPRVVNTAADHCYLGAFRAGWQKLQDHGLPHCIPWSHSRFDQPRRL